MMVNFSFQGGFISGMRAGVITGSLFGFLTWISAKIYEKRQVKKFSSFRVQFVKSHELFYESVATCLVRGVPTEGRLYLTSDGLFFKSKSKKADTAELWIHFGFMKSLIRQDQEEFIVKQEDRRQIKFVVPDAGIWLRKMQPFVPREVLFQRDK